MTPDPQRLQYLEAMGITAWTSRYRFVNARESERSEWQLPEAPKKAAPGERLHALLETPADAAGRSAGHAAGEAPTPDASPSEAPASSRARALLGEPPATAKAPPSALENAEAETGENDVFAPALERRDPLRFRLSLAILAERWWLILPGERPLSSAGEALLNQQLAAAGLPVEWRILSTFSWPLMDVPTTDPEAEAREGIEVFCAGQAQRNALQVDGAIVVGADGAWAGLLPEAPADGESMSWQHWPHPDDLLGSADAKRDCWPLLRRAGDHWRLAGDGAETAPR
ncbi:hypothetical protein [Salinicola rhizosphaerae]|uniref:Uncharacterized protein n=1 Tax=Salinicola rhizosphaerae TaxID=1443141 RepID=A0ABQ3DZ60_9GAMM|nr:hypothetical protein [Salinicola rhizosphaerae]GHB19629.1 hypothetical protein GCM10009038_17900 [Salinicola rhizosphaerae]